MREIEEIVWARVSRRLREVLGERRFGLWLAGARLVSFDGNRLRIGLANAIAATLVESRFGARIRSAVADVLGTDAEVDFVVDPEQFRRLRAAEREIASVRAEAASDDFSLPLERSRRLEYFIEGESNRTAHKCVLRSIESPCSAGNPLILSGPSGVGKSHLLVATGLAARERRRRVFYTTPEHFADAFSSALRDSETARFRMAARRCGLFLLDDADGLPAVEGALEEIFYTLERLLNGNSQVMIAMRGEPRVMGALPERLRARLMRGVVVKISPPGRGTRQRLAENLLLREPAGAPVHPDVAAFVAERFRASGHELTTAIRQIRAYAISVADEGREVSVDDARTILAPMLRLHDTQSLLTAVAEAVAEKTGVAAEEIVGGSRRRDVTEARDLFFALARRAGDFSLSRLGAFAGGRTHAAVHSALKRAEKRMKTSSRFAALHDSLARRFL